MDCAFYESHNASIRIQVLEKLGFRFLFIQIRRIPGNGSKVYMGLIDDFTHSRL